MTIISGSAALSSWLWPVLTSLQTLIFQTIPYFCVFHVSRFPCGRVPQRVRFIFQLFVFFLYYHRFLFWFYLTCQGVDFLSSNFSYSFIANGLIYYAVFFIYFACLHSFLLAPCSIFCSNTKQTIYVKYQTAITKMHFFEESQLYFTQNL